MSLRKFPNEREQGKIHRNHYGAYGNAQEANQKGFNKRQQVCNRGVYFCS
jgi:hypothetical protein